jgi:hypothetical protein
MMLVHIVMQLLGKIICPCTQALVWLKVRLYRLVSNLRVRFFLTYLNVVNLQYLPAQTVRKCKVWLANLITPAQSTKQEPINARHLATQLGLQPQIIVAQTQQPVLTAHKQKKGKPVGITKSARSRTKKNKTVQTHTAALLTQAGLKSQTRVSQLLQRVKQAFKKGL